MDARGTHGLSRKQVAGRMTRHHWINDLVWRAMSRANIPSCKESNGLSRSDGRRPDGMTLIPWKAGKALSGMSQLSIRWPLLIFQLPPLR